MKTLILAAVLLALPTLVAAQNSTACRVTTVNALGTAGADITIDGTAGGIAVLAAMDARCAVIIRNTGSAPMRCAPTTLTVSGTVGFYMGAGDTLVLGEEGKQAWKCIRTAGSTTANIAEARPLP